MIFLSHQIRALSDIYDVTVVANLHENKNLLNSLPSHVEIVNIPIQREIHLLNDVKALFLLIIFFYKKRFCLVHSISPKAGLLTMISSWLVRIPTRLHTFTGQVWATNMVWVGFYCGLSTEL